MKLAFVLLFLAAIGVQVWTRLSRKTKANIAARISKAKVMVQDLARAVRDKLFRRRMSWRHLFLADRGELSPVGKIVLADLTRFCRGMNTLAQVSHVSGQIDPMATGVAIGRHEVWLYVMKRLNVDPQAAIAAMIEEDALAA